MTQITITDSNILWQFGEYFAAGLFENAEAAPIIQYSRATRRWLENCPVGEYSDTAIFPSGKLLAGSDAILNPSYSFTLGWNEANFQRKLESAAASNGMGERQQKALKALRQLYDREEAKIDQIHTVHTIGGRGYTHAIVNYGRVLNEGLDAYERSARQGLRSASGADRKDFYLAMLDLLEGIRAWHGRLRKKVAEAASASENQAKLVEALQQVPFGPARNFYEAVVAYNFIYYLDGCDNPGRMDQVLWPTFQQDGTIDHNQALALLREFFGNVSTNGGWSLAIGGSQADGTPAYQEMTEICLEASQGHYRPSLELRVRPDMPDKVWELAMETLGTGCGQPAFYNEPGYLSALRSIFPEIPQEDLVKWNGGGCTETMLHGCSNVGSLDAGINLPLILEGTLERILAREEIEFAQLLQEFKDDIRKVTEAVLSELNDYFEARAAHRPQPLRSLLIDDCLERGLDFNAGGARYNWSVVNIAGLSNVADSLQALREVAFEGQEITPASMLDCLRQNFAGCEPLRQRLLGCAKFGNDLAEVDALAAEIAQCIYQELLSTPCQRGGHFLPSHIQFETFGYAGQQVGASPDGRRAGEPLADSAGPVQGRDRRGPTAMLQSVARLPLHLAAGTPVLNLRVAKGGLATPAGREKLRALIETYFQMGGMQLQVSVVDRAELLAALEHPEWHEDLIVRIGGYSTYFNWLSPELKQEVIKRTEYLV